MKSCYYRPKAEGRCARCGKPVVPGKTLCAECLEKMRARAREDYQWHKANGICVQCGKEKAEPGKTMCLVCLGDGRERVRRLKERDHEKIAAKGREYAKARYRRLKEAGICTDCGKRPPRPGKTTCEYCAAKRHISYQGRYEPRTEQREWIANGLCRFCGEPAVPGLQVCERHRQHLSDIGGDHGMGWWP